MAATLVYGTHKLGTPIINGVDPMSYLKDVGSVEAALVEAIELEASGFHVFRIMDERCERILMVGDSPLSGDELRLVLKQKVDR